MFAHAKQGLKIELKFLLKYIHLVPGLRIFGAIYQPPIEIHSVVLN